MCPGRVYNTIDHLSRVYAFVVYQTIRLYDGDIRLRHVAETQIPTLYAWLRQLIKSAKWIAREGPEKFIYSLLLPSKQIQRGPDLSHPAEAPNSDIGLMTDIGAGSILNLENVAWYVWLFAETIRRTWLIACTIQTIYPTLQVLWATCPGGVPFTARDGLFSASYAYIWASKGYYTSPLTTTTPTEELETVARTLEIAVLKNRFTTSSARYKRLDVYALPVITTEEEAVVYKDGRFTTLADAGIAVQRYVVRQRAEIA
ncbi:hypothetical protein VMCG_10372 [Cytospora schulzeri]|uniref:Uncharacterized protein n=1 Tax=Cytospora schulzeri TaxID=448051 RepID=A0A423VC64_9PEZI|nr:hypothetical protein VMCG_10372 [Valsa malicola]